MNGGLVPVTDEQEVILVPAGFHGKVFVVLRNGSRWMKVPARITASWKSDNADSMHFVVDGIDIVSAEEWRP